VTVKGVFRLPDGGRREIDIPEGWSLMEGARQTAISGIVAECGGGAICGTCHVRVDPRWFDQLEEPEMSEAALLSVVPDGSPTSRLACQIMMSDRIDGIEVEIPESQLEL
jgi:2Fe-2S ferredoxin